MLGLIFIYFLGKYFYQLAEKHNKNTWGYAILGVASYYVGTFIGGVFLFIMFDIMGTTESIDDNEFLITLITIPFGLLVTYLVYIFLKRRFENQRGNLNQNSESEFLDDGLL